jgi:ferredoxin
VGCGRCITWCPVAIDITEEVSAIRASESAAIDLARGKHDANA